jgi:hypothetical protein
MSNLSFDFCKTFFINFIDLVVLYIHAQVSITTNTLHGLDTSSFITKGTANDHTDTMNITFGSVVKTSTPIFLINEIDRVSMVGHYVHVAEVFIRCSLSDLLYPMLFGKLVMDNIRCINEHSSRISVLVHLVDDICVAL